VRGFETALNSEIDLLMTRLAEIADGKTTVSMMEEFDHLTLDIIGNTNNTDCHAISEMLLKVVLTTHISLIHTTVFSYIH
jgi:hypothetical protein